MPGRARVTVEWKLLHIMFGVCRGRLCRAAPGVRNGLFPQKIIDIIRHIFSVVQLSGIGNDIIRGRALVDVIERTVLHIGQLFESRYLVHASVSGGLTENNAGARAHKRNIVSKMILFSASYTICVTPGTVPLKPSPAIVFLCL